MRVEVLTRAELVARLGGRRATAAALQGGEWRRVLRGTYVPSAVVLDLRVKAQAAQRLLPAHAVVADRCLLWLLGIDVLPPGPPDLEVAVPRGAVVVRGLACAHGVLAASRGLPLARRPPAGSRRGCAATGRSSSSSPRTRACAASARPGARSS